MSTHCERFLTHAFLYAVVPGREIAFTQENKALDQVARRTRIKFKSGNLKPTISVLAAIPATPDVDRSIVSLSGLESESRFTSNE